MNFFVDFEATQPEGEIISIGITSENGEEFYSLVKPCRSQVTPYITQLTHITEKMLADAPSANLVFEALYCWLKKQCDNMADWHFFCYGKEDVNFLRFTIGTLTRENAIIAASIMGMKMTNFAENTEKFFHTKVSLIKAYNYILEEQNKQQHNALDDAKMLSLVFCHVTETTPPQYNPFIQRIEVKSNGEPYNSPSGTFTARRKGQIVEFGSCEDAIDWLLTEVIRPKDVNTVHRDRIMKNIMKAIRTKGKYCTFSWERTKEEK